MVNEVYSLNHSDYLHRICRLFYFICPKAVFHIHSNLAIKKKGKELLGLKSSEIIFLFVSSSYYCKMSSIAEFTKKREEAPGNGTSPCQGEFDLLRHASKLWDPNLVLQHSTDETIVSAESDIVRSSTRIVDQLYGKTSASFDKAWLNSNNGVVALSLTELPKETSSNNLSPEGVPVSWQMTAGGEPSLVSYDSVR